MLKKNYKNKIHTLDTPPDYDEMNHNLKTQESEPLRCNQDLDINYDRSPSINNEKTTVQLGIGFELECKRYRERLGYTAQLTKASGDFGVDIIANVRGKKVAIQCKNWANNGGKGAWKRCRSRGRSWSILL